MKHKSPAFQWYPKQFLGDDKVLAMDWDARGMHVWLINIAWQQEPPGTIPDDVNLIRRWLGNPTDEIWRRVWPQLCAAWPAQDSRRINPGVLRAAEKQQVMSASRKKSALARYDKSTKDARKTCDNHEGEDAGGVVEGSGYPSEKILLIALAHPKNAHLGQTEIPHIQITNIIEAIQSEVRECSVTPNEAAEMIYHRTVAIGGIMKAEGRANYLKSPERFFALREYRIPDQEWKANGSAQSRQDTIVNHTKSAIENLKRRGSAA